MPLWTMTDQANGSVLAAPAGFNKAPNTANRDNLFGNVTPGAFVANLVVGQFGVDTTETTVNGKVAHAGWILRRAGTGSLTSITITAGGTTYDNTDLVVITSPQAGGNGAATLTTNSTGGITAVTITNFGSGFINSTPTVTITNATSGATGGSGATLTPVVGGRAGRIHYETLVASSTITSDASDDTYFPDS